MQIKHTILHYEKNNEILYTIVEGILKFCKENLKIISSKQIKSTTILSEKVAEDYCCNIEIKSGDCLEDRKSIFQAHIAMITSKEDVRNFLNNF